VIRTHAHTEHALQVVDMPNVVVFRGTLEQLVVSTNGSINICRREDN
jgi:hypothetical protein